jgi:hypothetical protein
MTEQQKIVATAKAALINDAVEREAGFCQRAARQVIQKALGAQFDGYWRPSAELTRRAFHGTRYYLVDEGFGQAGDLLYFAGTANQTAGHVVINIGGGLCFQNSVTDAWDAATGHKGTRALKRFRQPTAVVRLWRA